MNAIRCESCNGTEFTREADMYVCQFCDTKYTPEKIKTMVIEGPVKIDNSDRLDNLFVLARRACKHSNYRDAIKYYEMILLENPNSWEAYFYVGYFSVLSADPYNFAKKMSQLSGNLREVFRLLKIEITDVAQFDISVSEISNNLFSLGQYMLTAAQHIYEPKNEYSKNMYLDNLSAIRDTYYALGDQIIWLENVNALLAWHEGIQVQRTQEKLSPSSLRRVHKGRIDEYVQKIKKFDNNYDPRQPMYSPAYSMTGLRGVFQGQASSGDRTISARRTGSQVIRPAMRTWSIICLVFAIGYIFKPLSSPSLLAGAFFFGILAVMFAVLARSYKGDTHVCLPIVDRHVSKKVFITVSIVLAFVLFKVFM